MRRAHVAVALGLMMALAGCTIQGNAPAPTVEVTTDPPAGPTSEPTSPATDDPAGARGPESPLEPIDAYALCKAQTTLYFDNFESLSWAPFDEAVYVERPDGDIGIYIEVVDDSRAAGETESAISCTVGGTLGDVRWSGFGNLTRLPAGEIEEMLRSTPQP